MVPRHFGSVFAGPFVVHACSSAAVSCLTIRALSALIGAFGQGLLFGHALRLTGREVQQVTVRSALHRNPVDESDFQRPSRNAARAFHGVLQQRGVPCSIRITRGLEAAAACGQLRNEHQKVPMSQPAMA